MENSANEPKDGCPTCVALSHDAEGCPTARLLYLQRTLRHDVKCEHRAAKFIPTSDPRAAKYQGYEFLTMCPCGANAGIKSTTRKKK